MLPPSRQGQLGGAVRKLRGPRQVTVLDCRRLGRSVAEMHSSVVSTLCCRAHFLQTAQRALKRCYTSLMRHQNLPVRRNRRTCHRCGHRSCGRCVACGRCAGSAAVRGLPLHSRAPARGRCQASGWLPREQWPAHTATRWLLQALQGATQAEQRGCSKVNSMHLWRRSATLGSNCFWQCVRMTIAM